MISDRSFAIPGTRDPLPRPHAAVFPIYIMGKSDRMKEEGGIKAGERTQPRRASLLYRVIDASDGSTGPVRRKSDPT